jgi:Ca2+:H+ antiporter
MDRQFWPGAIVMVFLARIIATMVTRCGRSAWFVGVFLLMVNLILALTLSLMPPRAG